MTFKKSHSIFSLEIVLLNLQELLSANTWLKSPKLSEILRKPLMEACAR